MVVCVAVPLAVGGISSMIATNIAGKYDVLETPFLAPPGWLFPIVWTILFILMGLASWNIWIAGKREPRKQAESRKLLVVYGVQLFFNFCWSIVFFGLGWYWLAFVWLMVMWGMIVYLVARSREVSMVAMWMLVPYLLWTTFAAYLNLSYAILN